MIRRLLAPFLCILTLAPILAHAAPATQPGVNLICWGDWGVDDPPRQRVADAAANFVKLSKDPIDAAILLGDNFKVPVRDVNDPIIQTIFEKTYDPKILSFPFYVALGNHDYEDTKHDIELEYARKNPSSRWKLPSDYYRVDLPAGSSSPLVTLIILDSDKDELSDTAWAAQTDWLGKQLAGPRGQWTLCCAHHTMFSNGRHGDNGVLQNQWGAFFKQYHVDFYICGHDHCQEHLEIPDWSTSFIISGGGGAPVYPMLRDDRGPFFKTEWGFAHLRLDPQIATVEFINDQGNLAHSFTRTKTGVVQTTLTTPNSPRSTNILREIQGIDDNPKSQSAQPLAKRGFIIQNITIPYWGAAIVALILLFGALKVRTRHRPRR